MSSADKSTTPKHPERRLAAVLAADVVAYSRLMGVDEEGTLESLKGHRRELINPKITEHKGRIVKTTGDGILIEFPSVVDALRCATEVQLGMTERNVDVPREKRIEFRAGINVGDIILDEGDIYGDGVNIAARLESLAEPGTVYISGAVFDQVRNKLPLRYDFLGEQHVKNISEAVRVYRVHPSSISRAPLLLRRGGWLVTAVLLIGIGVTSVTYWQQRTSPIESAAVLPIPSPGGLLSEQPSIAVLPFANMSSDPSLEYFVDGITEDLTTWLSQNPELRVISRTSAFAYKGKSPDIRQIGRELGARYILEGSVRKDSDRVRITAQLIETASGSHVWAERYDEEGNDVAALQDAVTHKIVGSVGSMHGQIRAADYRNAWSKDATKLQEYDYFLRIHGLIMRGPKEDLEEARQVAFEGLKRFPDSAIIKIKLAWTYLNDVRRGFSDDPRRDLERAFALGSEGMAGKDIPRLGQMHGHWLMALAYFYCKQDYSRALDERDITLAMAPIDAIVYVDLSQTLTFAGRPMEALNSIHKAIELDPSYPAWFHTYLAEAYYAAGKSREALDELAKINQPAFRDLVYRAASHASLGQLEEARLAVAGLQDWNSSVSLAKIRYLFPYRSDTDRQRVLDDLRKASLPQG